MVYNVLAVDSTIGELLVYDDLLSHSTDDTGNMLLPGMAQ